LETFFVPEIHTWKQVGVDLIRRAMAEPLPQRDDTKYSATEEEALQKAKELYDRDMAAHMVKHSAAVIYKGVKIFSITLTQEPNPDCLHVSMTRISGPGQMERIDDWLCCEIVSAMIGDDYEERTEGPFPNVRHFYKTLPKADAAKTS
jgi:hypothetical protein